MVKTIILAGGLGTRLSEETKLKPKPMVEIGDRPILHHIMNTYSNYGFKDFIIALGYKGDIVKDYFLNINRNSSDLIITGNNAVFENNHQAEWNIELRETGLHTLTGGRLLRLKRLFNPGDTFMLTYGDGLSNVNIRELLEFHYKHGKLATMTAVHPPARFGTIETNEEDLITDFKEKPQTDAGWINGGYFVFNYGVFDYLENDATILEREPLELLSKNHQLMAYKHYDFWQCMDTIRDRDLLRELWNSGNAPW